MESYRRRGDVDGGVLRAATAEARMVLEAAAAHCVWRTKRAELAREAVADALFPDDAPPLPRGVPCLDAIDLMIAIACFAPAVITARLPNGLAPEAKATLDATPAALSALPCRSIAGLRLADGYARHWTWNRHC